MLTQSVFEQNLAQIEQQMRNLYQECNTLLREATNIPNQQIREFYDQVKQKFKQIDLLEEEYIKLTAKLVNKENNLKIWVPSMEKLKGELQLRLKAPLMREDSSDLDTQKADQMRQETLYRLEHDLIQDFIQQEFSFFLSTIQFKEGTLEEYKQFFYNKVYLLMATEAGIRLIIKFNEDYKINGNLIKIAFCDEEDRYVTEKRYPPKNLFFSPTGLKAKADKVPLSGQATFANDLLQFLFPKNHTIYLAFDGANFSLFTRGSEVVMAHEMIHRKHNVRGKSSDYQTCLPWNKLPASMVKFFYNNPEEIITINPLLFTTPPLQRISDALISVERGYEARVTHQGEPIKGLNYFATILDNCKLYTVFFAFAKQLTAEKVPNLENRSTYSGYGKTINFAQCDLSTFTSQDKTITVNFMLKLIEMYSISNLGFSYLNLEQAKLAADMMIANGVRIDKLFPQIYIDLSTLENIPIPSTATREDLKKLANYILDTAMDRYKNDLHINTEDIYQCDFCISYLAAHGMSLYKILSSIYYKDCQLKHAIFGDTSDYKYEKVSLFSWVIRCIIKNQGEKSIKLNYTNKNQADLYIGTLGSMKYSIDINQMFSMVYFNDIKFTDLDFDKLSKHELELVYYFFNGILEAAKKTAIKDMRLNCADLKQAKLYTQLLMRKNIDIEEILSIISFINPDLEQNKPEYIFEIYSSIKQQTLAL
jgi:hypothetical protein